MDPIDRQAAIDEIGRFIGYIDEDMINRIRIGLKRLPSAQPTIERKRGKWVTHEESHKNMCYYIKCSECGKEAIWTNGFSLYPPNFCPNCGADMREVTE